MKNTLSASYSDSKNHYEILDGLRGVAAIVVVIFHLLETFSGGNNQKQIINHGYLAVDFFFVLSGFVIGYAYDDRWSRMSLKDFFKRRLIRLHPMILVGMLIGALTFYGQGGVVFPGISEVPVWKLLLVFLIGCTLLPVPPSMDIRGWTEMHTLDGPAWSLFFEYIANILYALFVRKFSNKVLAVLVFVSACVLTHMAITRGDVIGGWSLDPTQIYVGFTRLMFPFFGGLLLSRMVKPGTVNHAFLWCSLLLIIILSVPRIGGTEHIWMNGLYVAFCIIVLFPVIVYMGASGKIGGKRALAVNRFLGDISYPLYITHYPLIYLFTAWVGEHKGMSIADGAPMALLVLALSILVAYVSVRWYDVPVRKWLTEKWMK